MSGIVAQTPRLVLRRLHAPDAPFILRLLNEPGWLRFIGDKNIHTLAAAERYIVEGPMAMYARLGFGLYLVAQQGSAEPIGICGLIKRDALEDVDLGFALLQDHWGRGYAREAGMATLTHARELGLRRIVAILSRENDPSARVLRSLGFVSEGEVVVPPGDKPLLLYSVNVSNPWIPP